MPLDSTFACHSTHVSLFVGFCLLDTSPISVYGQWMFSVWYYLILSVSRSHFCARVRALVCARVDVLFCSFFIWKYIVSRNMRRRMIEIVCMYCVHRRTHTHTLFCGNLLTFISPFFHSLFFFCRSLLLIAVVVFCFLNSLAQLVYLHSILIN